MEQSSSRLQVSQADGVIIAKLADRKILDEMNIAQIGEQLNALIADQPQPRIVLDFESVSHMSSSALGMLITLHKRVRERDGQLRLCNIQPAIHEVFVITRLNEILQIVGDRDEAVASLR
jgi:anti-sigma B factor antagonist